MEPRELVDKVESFRARERASCTLLRINDKGLIATLIRGKEERSRSLVQDHFVQERRKSDNPEMPSVPVRFPLGRPLRPIRSGIVLVVGLGSTIDDHSGQGHSGTTGRSQRGHRDDIVHVGGAVARVLVPVRVDVDRGRTGGRPLGRGGDVGHDTGKEWRTLTVTNGTGFFRTASSGCSTYLPASSTTVARMNSVDLSLAIT